jgi:hypothetical protein
MAIECGVITGILLMMVVVFFRAHRKQWGWATVPLMLVPVTDFVMEFLVGKAFKLDIEGYWGIFALLVAVAASCAWIGFMSNSLKNKRTRITYIGIANAFNVLLAAILIYNIMA